MIITAIRNIILIVGWLLLLSGSVYITVRGRHIYLMIKGSLVGRITKMFIYTILVAMFCLGVTWTVIMFSVAGGVFMIVPIFLLWLIMFVWVLYTLDIVNKEVTKLSEK